MQEDLNKFPKVGYTHNETEFTPFNEERVLFFPLSYNEEQQKVDDILNSRRNCLLKGGPGTGKTQTLANLLIDAFVRNKRVVYSSKNKYSLNALEEMLPEYVKKYVLMFPENSGVEDVRKRLKPYLRNIQELLEKSGGNSDFNNAQYLTLIEDYNLQNANLVEVNGKVKDLLEMNQQAIYLNGQPYSFQMAYDFLNMKKNYPMMAHKFTAQDYDALSIIDWKEFVTKLNFLSSNDLKFLDMDEKILTHTSLIYPDTLMLEYSEVIQKLKKNKLIIDGSMRELNKKDSYPHILQKFEEFKQLIVKFNVLLDEKNKQNFIKFFSRRKSLHLIEPSVAFFNENLESIIESDSFDVKFPASGLQETEYLKDLEALASGTSLDSVMFKLTKKKQKDFFEEVRVFDKPVVTTETWKRVYDKVMLNKAAKAHIAKWNEHANTFGLPQVDTTQPVDLAFASLKKYLDVFYLLASSYIQLEQLILPYMDLPGTPLENVQLLQNYVNALSEKEVILNKLQLSRASITEFIQQNFLIPKNINSAYEAIKADDFDLLVSLIEKEIKEEESYRPIKETYQYIHKLSKDVEFAGGDSAVDFLKLFFASGYTLKVDPSEVMLCVKKTILNQFVKSLNTSTVLNSLMDEKKAITKQLKEIMVGIVENRIQHSVLSRIDNEVGAVLDTMSSLLVRLETGRENRETYVSILVLLKDIVKKMPVSAMINYKAFDYFPGSEKVVDLWLVDDASQEGFEYLPLLLKGESVVVAGDERMFSTRKRYPVENFDIFKSKYLMHVPMFLYEMITPSSSLLDIATSIFYKEKVVLSENFRNEAEVFAFANSIFYENAVVALRASDFTVDASLVNVFTKDAEYTDGVNIQEARYIVQEIQALISQPKCNKTIGIIALSGSKQAEYINRLLSSSIPEDFIQKHKIVAGVPFETQGRERDIVFISLGITSEEQGGVADSENIKLAMTRAKESVYLVHSILADNFKNSDNIYVKLLDFFQPKVEANNVTGTQLVEKAKSSVEKDILAYLLGREYLVKPQTDFGKFSVDMMIYDYKSSLAIEIEGDVREQDYNWKNSVKRQLELEEVGWNFYRVLYSQYCFNKSFVMDSMVKKINSVGVISTPEAQEFIKKRVKMITFQ